ncbi:MAG: hypothetical protein JNM24_05245 [Bdellovibrionaceae bacterium]|nr:hypothetical protein [Pseudobdellovibrionaceae bacterium]
MIVAVGVSNRKINFVIHELKNISSELSLADEPKSIEILQCEVSSITFRLKKTLVKVVSEAEQNVTIEMNQYDSETWHRIIENISKKQRHVDKLFQAMRGED